MSSSGTPTVSQDLSSQDDQLSQMASRMSKRFQELEDRITALENEKEALKIAHSSENLTRPESASSCITQVTKYNQPKGQEFTE